MIINELETGSKKVIEKISDGEFTLNTSVKEEIISQFKNEITFIKSGELSWNDKLGWVSAEKDDRISNFRMCPGSWIRKGVFIGKKVIFMPCFVNIGAHIGDNTMIDSGVTIGSCAYIGENCHISSNVVIAGVLEPIQDRPTIIDDNCFVGAQCLVSEGVLVEKGSILATGTRLTQSTRIYDRKTGEYSFGRIPANSVVVPGSYPTNNGLHIACAVIVGEANEESRKQVSLRDLLRS